MALNFPRVEIEWEDASNMGSSWMALADARQLIEAPLTVKSVGYVIAENKKRVLMAGDISEHGVNSLSLVPKPWIRRRTLV